MEFPEPVLESLVSVESKIANPIFCTFSVQSVQKENNFMSEVSIIYFEHHWKWHSNLGVNISSEELKKALFY